ncbi:MAG: hypothetical protein ACP5D2_00070 [Candidatus Nanoarchaeia archaeon]
MSKPKITERHIRWNCEPSQERDDETYLHILVVDNKNLDASLDRAVFQQGAHFGAVEIIKELTGKAGHGLKYLFRTYAGQIDPARIDWDKTGKRAVRDHTLYERKSKAFSLDNYVENLFNFS